MRLLVSVALGDVALMCSIPHLSISAIYGLIWMKPKSFNHIFFTEYSITTLKSATPILVVVALVGLALNCSGNHLSISAINGPIWMKQTPFNHIFLIKYINTTLKSATPLWQFSDLPGLF